MHVHVHVCETRQMWEPSWEAGQSWPTPEPCERLTSSVSRHMWVNTIHTAHNCVRMHFEQRGVCADEAGAGRHHNMPSRECMKDHQAHGKGTRTNCHHWPSLPLFRFIPLVKCTLFARLSHGCFVSARQLNRKKEMKTKSPQHSLTKQPKTETTLDKFLFAIWSHLLCFHWSTHQTTALSRFHLLKMRMNQVGKGEVGWPGTN